MSPEEKQAEKLLEAWIRVLETIYPHKTTVELWMIPWAKRRIKSHEPEN